jgi:hypothetical protein
VHATHPLGEKGFITKDYYLLKRFKKQGQQPVPDLEDEKVLKRYKKL